MGGLGCAQDAVAYTAEQRSGLLTAQNQLFARMHEILEAREAIMNTLQVGRSSYLHLFLTGRGKCSSSSPVSTRS